MTHVHPQPDRAMDWREQALCAQTDLDSWFPEKGGIVRPQKRICGECPVRAECLEYALTMDERHGIWGGLTTDERNDLRRGRPRRAPVMELAACGTEAAYMRHRRAGEQACNACSFAATEVRRARKVSHE